jgi:predicted PurR-regulated permease PerM
VTISRPKAPEPHEADDEEPAGHPTAKVVTARWTAAGRVFAIVVGAVLAVQFLRLAKPVVLPLVGGIFLAILARPLHVRVRDALPRRFRWLGLIVAMLAIFAGVAAFGAALALSGRAVASEFQSRRPRIEAQLERVRSIVSRSGIPISETPGGEQSSQGTSGAPQERREAGADSGAVPEGANGGSGGGDFASRVLRALATGITGLGLALAFAALGLAEAGEVRQRIAHLGRGGGASRALAAIDEAAPAFRRYVWVKSITSAITGIATWLASLAFGLPLAWVWGFLAFLLEYVPSIGSLLAVLPPTLMALADAGPGKALAVLLVIGALQVILGNVVDPRLEGRLMAISPFGVLLSIVFWGWLWGAVGALLAVPLTVAMVIACRHIPGARGFATVVAGDGVPNGDPP